MGFTDNTNSVVSSSLKSIFTVGMFFGIMPLKSSVSTWGHFHKIYSVYTLVTNSLILAFAIILFFRDLASQDADLVEQFLDMTYHCHILITIVTCIYQSRNISSVLETWDEVELLLKAYESEIPEDRVVFRKRIMPIRNPSSSLFPEYPLQVVRNDKNSSHSRFISTSKTVTRVYVFCVFMGAASYFITISIKENVQSWSQYFDEVAKIYVIKELCGSLTGFYVLFVGHVMELIWAFGDMLILLVSLTLWYQFKRFNRILNQFCKRSLHSQDIEDLRIVHWTLAKATKKTNQMLKILTTTVFICNILYLFSRVFNGIEEDLRHPNWFITFEAVYAFSYLIVRIFATAIIAAKFSSTSTAGFRDVARCDSHGKSELDYLLVDRFCNQLLSSNVAISGSGYFYLNRGFIATLVSALVTYEVVILQFSVAARSKEGKLGNGTSF